MLNITKVLTKDVKMKSIIIYYSYEENTDFIAKIISDSTGSEILRLKPKKEPIKKGLSKFLWGGLQVMLKKKPDLEDFEFNPDNYDTIFIGTPVWAGSFTPAINSFFAKYNNIKNKKIALFVCNAGGKGKIYQKLENKLAENEILGKIDFIDPLKKNKDKNENKARKWATKIMSEIK